MTMIANPIEERVDIFNLQSEDMQRQFIRNIVDSYHHDWDVLAELCQNAVDAIRLKAPPEGAIVVRFDRQRHIINIRDTGVGMDRDTVARALAPNVTFKRGQPTLIGEKGLGLTFCAFRANKITIETSPGDGLVHTAVFEGGRDWLENSQAQHPLVVLRTREEASESFTRVVAEGVPTNFQISQSRLEHLALTRTALGGTYAIWPQLNGKNPNISTRLSA